MTELLDDAEPRRRVALLDGPLHRAGREHRRASSTSTSTRSSTCRWRTAARRGGRSCSCSATRSAYAEHYDCADGDRRERLGPLARRQPERRRQLHHARPRERALGPGADLRRDVGGDQQALPARARRRPPRGLARAARVLRATAELAHLFQGTADATMTHGDPYEFIRLGLQLERAATTVRVVASRYPVAVALDEDDSARARQLIALLESCSAFEAFVKRYGTMFEPVTIADELIRSADFPRAVRFCLAGSLDSLTRISNDQGLPHRILGRLVVRSRLRRGGRPVRAGGDADAGRGSSPASTRPATRSRRRTSRAARFLPRARSRRRRRSSSNVADGRARDSLLVRRADQRGVLGAAAQARAPGRAAVLVVHARDRAARASSWTSTGTASATPSTTSTCSSRTRRSA